MPDRPELLSPALLITESKSLFNRAYQDLSAEFPERGTVEKNLIFDITHLRLEIDRYRRVETACINRCYRDALANLLTELLRDVDVWPFEAEEDAETLAVRWFTDATIKEQISRLLTRLNLDVSAIEAEAVRCAAPQIELLQRIVASLESRWHRAVRTLRQYRAESVGRLGNSRESVIEAEATEIAPRRLSSAR
jgi:hypothetical protein